MRGAGIEARLGQPLRLLHVCERLEDGTVTGSAGVRIFKPEKSAGVSQIRVAGEPVRNRLPRRKLLHNARDAEALRPSWSSYRAMS